MRVTEWDVLFGHVKPPKTHTKKRKVVFDDKPKKPADIVSKKRRMTQALALVKERPGICTTDIILALDAPKASVRSALFALEIEGKVRHETDSPKGSKYRWFDSAVQKKTDQPSKDKNKPRKGQGAFTRQAIIDAMSKTHYMLINDIANRAGYNANTVRKLMMVMRRDGLVEFEIEDNGTGQLRKRWRLKG